MEKVIQTNLKKLQYRALRFVFNDHESSYEYLLNRGNFLSLSMNRLRLLAIEVFKSVKKLNPDYINDMFNLKNVDYDLRDSSRLSQPKFQSVKFGYKSFSYYGSKLWNHIPANIKDTDDLELFKIDITTWCKTPEACKLKIF